ncbi:hypothetical protein OJ253_2300 [Cryptosporidium canis]|uniref:Uncharacterized protein n=1 Tax=Cryptosporidium canis TaxID=195482 RepID=A0A9D5DHP6_9CRYT|nr:hypothetical protein OJ253_2300 [Cryptosporidium canis]
MIGNDIHIAHYHPPINWNLLRNDLILKRATNKTLERFVLDHTYPFVSRGNRTIDSLSRVFSRIISNELQSNVILDNYGFFVSTRYNEGLYKIDVCANSRLIYQCIVDIWFNSDIEFDYIASNITKSETIRSSHMDLEKTSTRINANLVSVLRNIIEKCGVMNKRITIWSIIPVNNVEFKQVFQSVGDDACYVQIIHGLLNICINDLQREFFNIKNVKIDIILIIEHPNTLINIRSAIKPILITNQNNSQFKVTCLDSRCLLSYSDVIIANSHNLLTLRLDFSTLLSGENAVLTFFIERNEYVLKYMDQETLNTESTNNIFGSTDSSDSEEGEVVEQENIIMIMEDEFRKNGWIKLVGNISLKLLGNIPSHWSPTALKIFPITTPVGRNNTKHLKEISIYLDSGSLLFGKNGLPLAALTINLSRTPNLHQEEFKSKNVNNQQFPNTNLNSETYPVLGIRNLFNLALIRRNPIIPVPISRKFNYESKVNSMVHTNITQQSDKYILFVSGKLQELFCKIKKAIKLHFHANKYHCSSNQIIKKANFPENAVVKKIHLTKDINDLINIMFASLPSLLTDFDQFITQLSKSLLALTHSNHKSSTLEEEKKYFESRFNLSKSKLIDLVFPNINNIDRKIVFTGILELELPNRLKSNKARDLQLLVSKLDDYCSLFLDQFPLSGCPLHSIYVSYEKLPKIISDREFFKQNAPKLFWLSICFLFSSLKSTPGEYQQILHIVCNGKDIEYSTHFKNPSHNI